MTTAAVTVYERDVKIPTYPVGKPEKNPMFLEKRVYQGSSGKVYPHPIIEKIYDEKVEKSYRLVIMENQYLYVELMPEMGGRIYRALDKTNQYDFVYYNEVIKPALVGITGPWVSGGIEFNWPQHHRPNTFGPVEYTIEDNKDGSQTVWMSEIDRMYGTKGMAGFTLHPDKAVIEITGQLYNRTSQAQTFLWWANPAIPVNDDTQSIFPPDVRFVFDHGKRDVSKFPVATGEYYKVDYSAGVDISKYKNIPVPTSYMVHHSDYNFVGSYDFRKQAGIYHVANRHISPGKKQWTWGSGDFGKAWDRNLTDQNGPYVELMTGVYTDNQPDFTWLQPYEEKRFTQYFMPYKDIGAIKNASADAAVNLELNNGILTAGVYTTSSFDQINVKIKYQGRVMHELTCSLSPDKGWLNSWEVDKAEQIHDYQIEVFTKDHRLLVDFQAEAPAIEEIAEAAKAIEPAAALANNEDLFLAGQHLEQYRHATFEPEDYYLEGLRRNPNDYRINNAYGQLLLRRGQFAESEKHLRKAVHTLTRHNPNPYDMEAFFYLGLCLQYQGKLTEAYRIFYKATWGGLWKDKAFTHLAMIAFQQKDVESALSHCEEALLHHQNHLLVRNLTSACLRALGEKEHALSFTLATIDKDRLDFGARLELYLTYLELGEQEKAKQALEVLHDIMRKDVRNYLHLAQDLLLSGRFADIQRLLTSVTETTHPMIDYYLGYVSNQQNNVTEAKSYYEKANQQLPDYVFPNHLYDYLVLHDAIAATTDNDKAHYYVGNLLYDKKRYQEAAEHWQESIAQKDDFPTAFRNLAFYYYNKLGNQEKASKALEQAFQLDMTDARVFYELDQLYKKTGRSPDNRLQLLEKHKKLVEERDDLFVEYVTLQNLLGEHTKALALINSRQFHPWEGGEGKITKQYVSAHIGIALTEMDHQQYNKAIDHLEAATVFPENLGEGKLQGAQENDIYYWLGVAYSRNGQEETAEIYWQKASQGLSEPATAMYYNDQPPEMIFYQGLACKMLGEKEAAKGKFNKLIDYGETQLFKLLKIDYFAVSLPDFLVFDEDMDRKNKLHCYFMMALGKIGLQHKEEAETFLQHLLELDPNHQGAKWHLHQLNRL
ncbi:DUF5107 domain-containing protein [Gracilibacillus alcaliphilus]|uniref:DUF5107 domain-containing protein n=1 Tax=Gracilibacillus alcaliphilus TaxID=1401441 RepID=UPI001EF7B674|nr:DUF5107 domain-containing protein [Gracilibacillus alcaliphilus]MBM7676192.1 tetratricopeptide (TPR) repeat protein [Gracilibacillus alcaliphilus]